MISNQKWSEQSKFPYCDDVTKFQKLTKIGHGSFGEVFKAQNIHSLQEVAIKKVLITNNIKGFPITALREIKILQVVDHENVVKLIEVCRSGRTTWLIFEFCEHDLTGLISNPNVKFSMKQIKYVLKQLLEGLYYIHSNNILHRDIKPSNILINKQGIIKIADFGLAKTISRAVKKSKPTLMTPGLVTLWYRSPEIVLKDRNYGPTIDVWSMGCVIAELWTRTAIFKADIPQTLLIVISKLCGSINPSRWPSVKNLELYESIVLSQGLKRRITKKLMPFIKNRHTCDLLEKLFTLDPHDRINANQALDHDFFYTDPMPETIQPMLTLYNQSMFDWLSRSEMIQRPSKKQKQFDENDNCYVNRIY